MRRLKFELEFKELEPDENLYDDINLEHEFVVDAQYLRRPGYEDNPDVCAIPKMPSINGIMNIASVHIPGYDYERVESMQKYEKLEAIEEIDHVMVPLGLHMEVVSNISKLLLDSYKNRYVVQAGIGSDSVLEKAGLACNILSYRKDTAPRPTGFFLYGTTGCGKTMAVQLACRYIPKAIYHDLGGISYTQIPIIRVTALEKQMSDVFRSIATVIDEILGTGDYHESKVRSATLTKSEGFVKKWIKMYHIGLIIIDELQFLNITEGAKGIQDIIGITQDTGCNFGFIGNEDARVKVFSFKRLYSRLSGNLIDADKVTTNSAKLFENAMNVLWSYQWTKSYTPLTKEIKELLIYETTMNIALLKYLIIKIQSEAVASGKKDPIDVDYIEKQTGSELKALRELLADPMDKKEAEYQEYVTRLYARLALLSSDEKEESRGQLLEAITKGKITAAQCAVRDRAVQSILDTTEYSETQVYRAVVKAVDAEPSLLEQPVRFLSQRAMEILKNATTVNKRKTSRRNGRLANDNNIEKDELARKAVRNLMDHKQA